jgi:hypothetical protein
MPSLPDEFAPYAPVGNILDLIHRLRRQGLPDPLTTAELDRLGIPEGNLGRVSQTLRFLGLIDEEGKRTEKLDVLGKASTDQYQSTLKQIVEDGYRSVFKYVDPATDGDIKVADQFRHFTPASVRDRMVALFLGLCQEAGIVPEGTVSRTGAAKNPPAKRPSNGGGQKQASAQANEKQAGQSSTQPKNNDDAQQTPSDQKQYDPLGYFGHAPKYQLLQVLLSQLPPEGKWTQKRRDQWLGAVTANVDLLVDISEPDNEKRSTSQENDSVL